VEIAELLGPPGLPAALYDPLPKTANDQVDWNKLHALVVAVEALVGAMMAAEARPLIVQLRETVEEARGPVAKVIDLGSERSRRPPS